MKLAALVASLALIASTALAAPDPGKPDAERLALGRRLVLAWQPDRASGRASAEWIESSVRLGLGFSMWGAAFNDSGPAKPMPLVSIDYRQLHASLMVGAAKVAPRLPDALGAVYARTLDRTTLQTLVAFFEAPDEQAALARRRDVSEATQARSLQYIGMLQGAAAPPPDEKRLQIEARNEALRDKQASAPTPQEQAFGASPAWRELAAKGAQLQAATDAVIQRAWPELVATARADYCGHVHCAAEARKLFDGFAKVDFVKLDARDAPAAQTFGNQTADQIFARPADAALAKAACRGDAAAVQAAVKAGGAPNAVGKDIDASDQDPWTFTPLVWAVTCRSQAGVEALLTAGANPNQSGANGETAVTIAVRLAYPEGLKLLLQHGGNPNAEGRFGVAALILVNSSPETLQVLLDAGADCRSGSGATLVGGLTDPGHWQELAAALRAGCAAASSDLAYAARNAQQDDADDPYRDDAIAALKARGVKFPVERPPDSPPPAQVDAGAH
jgi:hypothetical protein